MVVVTGRSTGGAYTVTVGSCIAGTWKDSLGRTWVLKESGTTITGTRNTSSAGCGVTKVTGTYKAPHITLYTNIVAHGCCSVKWTGTVTSCKVITGKWTQTGGARGCSGNGSYYMNKGVSASTDSGAETESAADPSCGSCNNK